MIPIPEIVFFQEGPGVRNTQYTTTGVKLLNVANLQDGKVDLSTSERYISEEEAYGKYKHFLVDDGDFIIASSGIQVDYFEKKMGFIDSSHLPLCMNTSTIRFKSLDEDKLLLCFFMYYLKTPQFKEQLKRLITGSAQLNFGPSHLKQMSIPLPPLETQQKIADVLDRAGALIEKRKAQIEKLDLLIKSQFIEMFGDIFHGSEKYPKQCIATVSDNNIEKVGKKYDSKDIIKYIDISSIDNEQNEIVKYTDYIVEKAPSRAQQIVNMGDVLVSTVRPNLKNVAVIRDSYDNLVASTGFCVLRPSKKINTEYLFAIVRTDGFAEYLAGRAKGANYPAVNSNDIKKFNIPIPPLLLQTQFADFVNQIEAQKSLLQQTLEKLELNYKSLMQKCFRGDLF